MGPVEPARVKRGDGVDHEPREVPLGQPLAQARRQQQLLLAITRDEVLRHPEMVLTAPDGPPIHATASPSKRQGEERGTCRASACARIALWRAGRSSWLLHRSWPLAQVPFSSGFVS